MHRPALRVLLMLTVCSLAALPPARADEPSLFDYRQIELENGLKVVTLEDFSCPIVAVHLWYHVGSKDEDPQRQGFAHMFEHMMFRGTDRLGPTDHFDYIRRSGGDCNAYTSWDQTVYVQTLPAPQLELALWLESERMSFLKIDQSAFDTERKVVEEERRLGLNRPYGDVPEKALTEIFKVHPYRWLPIGNIAHLRASSVQNLRDFWTTYYVPNNATLVIVGAVKHDEAQRLARQYFGWIPRYPDPPRVTAREPQPTAARNISIKAESAPTPVVGMMFRTVPVGHADGPALSMLGSILGGGASSRLYRQLVAEERSAVFAGAAAFELEQDGFIAAGAALAPIGGDTKKVLATVQSHIDKLREQPVSDEELSKARNQMLSGIVTTNLGIESKASALGSAAVLEGNVANVNKRLDEIRKVTPADVLRVAKEYMAPERAHTIMVERNLLGMLMGGGAAKKEENAPITAAPETTPPPPGRPGLKRPDAFPATAPVAKAIELTNVSPKCDSNTLENGLKVMVVRNTEVPYVTVQLGMKTGAYSDSKPGVASMAYGMLTKGSANHSEGELAKELETYAISLGGGAGMNSSSVSAGCLSEHVDRAVSLLSEVVRTPKFPEEEFTKLRDQTRTGLAISSAEPSYIAEKEFRKQIYGDHPYARTTTGEVTDLDAMESEDLSPWWGKQARPDVSTLIFAGDITTEHAMKLAKQHFGDWKAEGPPPPIEGKPLPAPTATRIHLIDRPGEQCQIRVGQLGITRQHPGYFTSRVVSDYFGGAFSSRLNETIRVKKGLTYGARGGFSSDLLAGTFAVSTFSKVESTGQAVQAIFDELKRLKAEPPTERELTSVKDYIVGSFPGDRETPQQVAGALWSIESLGLPADYFEKLLAGVAGTSSEDCTKLVGSTVDPDKMTIVVVGPAERIKAELEKIAPVTVSKGGAATEEDDE